MCILNSIKFNYLFIKRVHYFWSNHLKTPWLCSLYIIVYSSNFPPVVLGYLGTDGIFLKSLFSIYCCYKVEKILKDSLDVIPSPSPSVKIQIMGGKVCLRCKGKTLLGIVNKLWKQKVCWHHPAMFCLITSSKLSRQ